MEVIIQKIGSADNHRVVCNHGDEYCQYVYNIGDTLELSCALARAHSRSRGRLIWIDSSGSGTDSVNHDAELSVRITPDRDDPADLQYICKSSADGDGAAGMLIVVSLLLNRQETTVSTQSDHRVIEQVIYLAAGRGWASTVSCNVGLRRLPNEHNDITRSPPRTLINDQIISNFNKYDNGTIFFCISYTPDRPESHVPFCDNVAMKRVHKFIRDKIKFTFLIKEEGAARDTTDTESKNKLTDINDDHNYLAEVTNTKENSKKDNTQIEKHIQEKEEEKNKNGEAGDNTALIVGCVMGVIILILLGAIVGVVVWYNKGRQRSRYTNPRQSCVIYSELEERSREAPPLPPRNDPPYAVILGSVVPADRPRRTTDGSPQQGTLHK